MSWLGDAVDWLGDNAVGVATGFVVGGLTIAGLGLAAPFAAAGAIAGAVVFGYASDSLNQWREDLANAGGTTPEREFKDRKQMVTAPDTPKPILYGESRYGGQVVLWESTGTDSQFLWMIMALAPHEVEEIGGIYFNDVLAVASGSSTGQDEFGGLVTAYRFDGTQTTADATLVSEIPSWTTDHIGEGVAYIAVKLEYDRDAYSNGAPRLSCVVKGKKLYDPRTDTTYYTDNHALCVLDFLRSEYGFKCDDSEIDFPSFEAGADVCEQQFDAADGGTEDRYTINGAIKTDASPIDNINSMLRAGAAMAPYVQGVFSYVSGSYSAPVANFDETDLIGEISYTTGPSKREATNVVKGSYIDSRQNYEPVAYPRLAVSAYITRDGEELVTELDAPLANSPSLARRLAKIAVESERFGVSTTVTMKYTASEISVGDRIMLSVDRLGWSSKVFRVMKSGLSLGSGVSLQLREDDQVVWDWSAGEAIDVTPPPAVNLPDRDPIPAPALTLTERVNTPNSVNQDLVTILMEATPPGDARYAYADFSYRIDGTNQWYPIGYSSQNAASVIVPASGATYEVRVRPVSQTGRVWNTANTDTITVWDRANEGLPQPERGKLPDIYGLRLLNPVERGNFTQFKSGRAEFAWQPQSQTESKEFSDDTLGVDAGQLDPYFDDYRVRFFVGGTLKFEDFSPGPRYVLSLEDNRRYDIGRSFTIEVVARGANGQLGAPETLDVENPAPAAPVIGVESGFTSFRLSFSRPDDIDFIGFDLYVIEGSGDPYTASPERLSGNSVTRDGLSPGSTYTVGVESVDAFGVGAQATAVELTLPKIEASTDVDGLGNWATLLSDADKTFIENNVGTNAIPSTRIETLVAGKIATGALVVAVDVGNGSNKVVIDGTSGLIQTVNTGYTMTFGAHDVPGESSDPLIISANDGVTYPFWVDVTGSAKFGDLLLANDGSITGTQFEIAANGDATFSGALSAASGSFAGSLSAASGTFTGGVEGGYGIFGDDTGLHVDINNAVAGRLIAYDTDGTTARITFGGNAIIDIDQEGVTGGAFGTDGLRVRGDRGDGRLLDVFHVGTSTEEAARIDGGLELINGNFVFDAIDTRRSIDRSILLGGGSDNKVHFDAFVVGTEIAFDVPIEFNGSINGGMFSDGSFELDADGTIALDPTGALVLVAGTAFSLIAETGSGIIETADDLEIFTTTGEVVVRKQVQPAATGNMTVEGDFDVNGTKNFNIPHPTKDGKRLIHGAYEGPVPGGNLYRERVTVSDGAGTITMPDWFEHINADIDIICQPVEHFGRAYGVVDGNEITVHADTDGAYLIVIFGTRCDPNVANWQGVERDAKER